MVILLVLFLLVLISRIKMVLIACGMLQLGLIYIGLSLLILVNKLFCSEKFLLQALALIQVFSVTKRHGLIIVTRIQRLLVCSVQMLQVLLILGIYLRTCLVVLH